MRSLRTYGSERLRNIVEYGRDIVAPPGNKATNRVHEFRPTLNRLQTTRRGVADRIFLKLMLIGGGPFNAAVREANHEIHRKSLRTIRAGPGCHLS
jgi:hypothetical protein